MHYMQAHGYAAGPTQRPVLAGFLTGLLAGGVALLVFELTRALTVMSDATGVEEWCVGAVFGVVFVAAGALYGGVFQSAANDFRGGWLFGISYGFLLWMLGPLVVLHLWLAHPMVRGPARAGILLANLAYGIVLGTVYPWVQLAIQRRLRDVWMQALREHRQQMHRCPHAPEHRCPKDDRE